MASMGVAGLWLSVVLVVAVAAALSGACIWLAHRLKRSRGGELKSPLAPFITTVALVYGALLGFTVVVAWEQFSSAEANVASEASTLATMYRQTVALSAPEQTRVRELLRAYTTATQGEWTAQGRDEASVIARTTITDLYRVLGTRSTDRAASPIEGEILNQVTTLTSQRNIRVLDARPRIPGLLWTGLVFGGTVLIGLTAFTPMESRRVQLVLTSAVATLLCLLLYIVYWLDHPFGDKVGVTPAPFGQSVQVFESVDHGT